MSNKIQGERVQEYRRLLTAEASVGALDDSILLMERAAGLTLDVPFVKALADDVDREESRDEEIRRHLSGDLRDYMASRFEESALVRRRKREWLRMQERCFRAATALAVPRFLRERAPGRPHLGESLILDIGLVVFHHAAFGLMPELTGAAWTKERALLLDSFLRFSLEMAEAPDSHRIQGLVHDLQGDPVLAWFHYRRAVQLSEPTAHEFMSVLQTAWSHAVQHGHFEDAILLLLENARRVHEDDLVELQALVVETLELRRAA